MKLHHTLVLVCLLGTAGQARADANTAIFDKLIGVIEQAGVIVDTNKSNCDAMGDKLGAHIDQNAQLISDAKVASGQLTPEQKQALETRYGTRIRAAMNKLRGGLVACSNNAKVMAAVQKLK